MLPKKIRILTVIASILALIALHVMFEIVISGYPNLLTTPIEEIAIGVRVSLLLIFISVAMFINLALMAIFSKIKLTDEEKKSLS